MNNFQKIRLSFNNAKMARDANTEEVRLAREQLFKLEKQLQNLQRKHDPDDSQFEALFKELYVQKERLSTNFSRAKSALTASKQAANKLHKELVQSANIKKQLKEWDDHFPILLFPIRLETRFKQVNLNDELKHQLWVRIYPDTCQVETHEEQLTEKEIEYGSRLVKLIRFPDTTTSERSLAAWRVMVKQFGAPRSAWILKSLTTEDSSDLQAKSKTASWSQPPMVNTLPDRFVVIAYPSYPVEEGSEDDSILFYGNPIPDKLVAGPDPTTAGKEGLRQDQGTGEIKVDEEMQWMVDFDQAVANGMGCKIDISAEQAEKGFKRLLVVGLRLSEDEEKGQISLQKLIENHHYAGSGMSLVPQGTATNNTESGSTSFHRRMDAETSIRIELRKDPLFQLETDPLKKRDGQWLAEWLGIDYHHLQHIQYSDGHDQADARAMNIALWPATLSYFMEQMMHPVFNEQVISETRRFFNQFVLGRGVVPAIRIRKQPYGILPISAFSKLFKKEDRTYDHYKFHQDLKVRLEKMDADWDALLEKVAHVGQGEPFDALSNILGLHASSVQFFLRFVESIQSKSDLIKVGKGMNSSTDYFAYLQRGKVSDLLTGLQIETDTTLKLFEKAFDTSSSIINAPIVDDLPPSEERTIKACTDDGRNYIDWLRTADLETIRQEDFGMNQKPPNSLLYLLLRHARILAYWDTTINLFISNSLLERSARLEGNYMYIREENQAESPWRYLYEAEPTITGSQDQLVVDFLEENVASLSEAEYMRLQLQALEHLKEASTARLERVFAEHIDLCSYRLDAWKTGLVNYQLDRIRFPDENEDGSASRRMGIYLGAYGWLEHVRPSEKRRRPPTSIGPNDIVMEGSSILTRNKKGGYIHGPSINHAVTAAVLRNAYITHSSEEMPGNMAMDLSSERVRRALTLIEGIRNGQNLGALLGYQLERALHKDKLDLAKYIYPLRKAFKLVEQKAEEPESKESIDATNVINGMKLILHIQKTENREFPYGKEAFFGDLLTGMTLVDKAAIKSKVDAMEDTFDAVGDLFLAEGVFQAVQGNFERAKAALDVISKGTNPIIPEISKTPRSGFGLTHRLGLHFDTGDNFFDLDWNIVSEAGAEISIRSKTEGGLNKWLMNLLSDDPTKIGVLAKITNERLGLTEKKVVVTLRQLKLQPIDLIYIFQDDLEQQMTELDERIYTYIVEHFTYTVKVDNEKTEKHLPPDTQIKIIYTCTSTDFPENSPTEYSLFEIAPLIKSVRALILSSRYLKPSDIALSGETDESKAAFQTFDIAQMEGRLELIKVELELLLTTLETNTEHLDFEAYLEWARPLFRKATFFDAHPNSLSGIDNEISLLFKGLLEKIKAQINRWVEKETRFQNLMDELNIMESKAEKMAILKRAERTILRDVPPYLPQDNDVEAYRTRRINPAKVEFDKTFIKLRNLYSNSTTSLKELINSAARENTAINIHDLQTIELKPTEDGIDRIKTNLQELVRLIKEKTKEKIEKYDNEIKNISPDGPPRSNLVKLQVLMEAGKFLMGSAFKFFPSFTLNRESRVELSNAFDNSDYILRHLKNDSPFPMEDWLYGLARVRGKFRHLENINLLTNAFGTQEMELSPLQIPHQQEDHWLGLQFPEDYKLKEEKLLYTAYFDNVLPEQDANEKVNPFQNENSHAGLLLDEWTETIPTKEETTGIAFNYDQPNSEPPQTLLLAVTPKITGQWDWEDLVDALNETLDMAKKRVIEPDHLALTASPYGHVLPAVMFQVDQNEITMGMRTDSDLNIYSQEKN